jgi:hypothetical protein
MYDLTQNDYKSILGFYNISCSTLSPNKIKNLAEDILANKLCRCIKKVQKKEKLKDEKKPIAVCKKSVLERKQIQTPNFKCKPKARFLKSKTKKKLYKLHKKTLKLGKKYKTK